MNRKSDPQTLPLMQVLPITPGPSLVPSRVLPVTPVVQQNEAFREQLTDTKDALTAVLEYYGSQSADRTARARRAGSTPKRKITETHIEIVEVWLAEMEYRLELGIRGGKGYIDRLVGKRFEVDYKTVERARVKAGYK